MSSAFPRPVDELVPAVRKWAAELGELPSRNKIKQRFRIGADKANAVLAILSETGFDPADLTGDTGPAATGGAGLHLVPPPVESEPPADACDVDTEHSADLPPVAAQTEPTVPAAVDPGTDVLPAPVADQLVSAVADPGTTSAPATARPVGRWWRWVLAPMAVSAFVAIWSGWVGLGGMTGFGIVHPLPGIADGFQLNTAITLPLGVEAYAAYALRVWLARIGSRRAQRFAKWSALGSLLLGSAGQVAYHLMNAMGITTAPWPITTCVACLPVVVLGLGAALAHLQHDTETTQQ
jgi:hypothetical protein